MNDIHSKAVHVEKLRKKMDQTWSEIAPKLTLHGLADEAATLIVKQRRSDALVSVVAIAGVAWLFNTYLDSFPQDRLSRSKR